MIHFTKQKNEPEVDFKLLGGKRALPSVEKMRVEKANLQKK